MGLHHQRLSGIIVLSMLLFVHAVCRAEYVPAERASVVASNFFHSNDAVNNVNKRLELYHYDEPYSTKSQDSYPSYYIFTGEDGKGFVIVTADDACQPIAGYSFDSSLPTDALPENFKSWLEGIDKQVRYVREKKKVASEQIRSQWQTTRAGSSSKELNTAKWNQGAPYNDRCPKDNGENSLTGCVATAAAIVMRYHKWPKRGKGETESYYTKTNNIYVASRNLNHSYDWDNMPVTADASFTGTQVNEVSVLMADVGAALKADYTSTSTSAYMDIDVLYNNFGFASSVHDERRDDFSDNEWTSMLRKELDENRPVLYSGQGTEEGHQFVVDGYDSGNYFHINWGWGGSCDGFFTINSLTPDINTNYSNDQYAVFGLRPPVDESDRIKNWLSVPGITSNGPEIHYEQNTPYYIWLDLYNAYSINFKGRILVAVTDRKGNIKEKLSESTEMVYGESSYTIYRTIRIGSKIEVGDRIRVFYKGDLEDEWSPVLLEQTGIPWEILIADEYYLHEITGFEFNAEQKRIKLTTKDGASIRLFDPEGNDVTNLMVLYSLDNIANAVIEADRLVEGKYKIVVSSGAESLDLFFSIVY